jgi:hypothetical protein
MHTQHEHKVGGQLPQPTKVVKQMLIADSNTRVLIVNADFDFGRASGRIQQSFS